MPTITDSARRIAEYLRSEAAADLLSIDQAPPNIPAIREALLDLAQLIESVVDNEEIMPAPGWMTNDSDYLEPDELRDALTRARWVCWVAASSLTALTAAAERLNARPDRCPDCGGRPAGYHTRSCPHADNRVSVDSD